jgi:hypothetical protein
VAFLISAIFSFGAFYLIGRKVDPVSIPSGEIPKAVAGFLAFAPFGIWANSALGLPAQFSLLALGGGAMFVTLVGLRQIAAVVVWQKGKRLLALN